jgi:hypothetical protein
MTSMTLVSGTFAKYTSEISGSDTGTVAKWARKIGNNTGSRASLRLNADGGCSLASGSG